MRSSYAPQERQGVLYRLLIYIMVDSVAETIDAIIAHGCEIAQPIGADAPEVTARFCDPGGNLIGLYQEPSIGHPGQTGG